MAMFDTAWNAKSVELAPGHCRHGHVLRGRAAKPFIRDYGSGVDWVCWRCHDRQTVVVEPVTTLQELLALEPASPELLSSAQAASDEGLSQTG